MRKILLTVSIYLLTACATVPDTEPRSNPTSWPENATNYDIELVVPRETENLVLVGEYTYDTPFLGVSRTYRDKAYPTDLITLYVYPIPTISWEDLDLVLDEEMDNVLAEVDYAVEVGHYQSRTPETRSDFEMAVGGRVYKGKHARFEFILGAGRRFVSEAVLLVEEDKFVKFRLSFDAELQPEMQGVEVVKEILPEVVVPPESAFMQEAREQHRQQIQGQLMQLILEAVESEESE